MPTNHHSPLSESYARALLELATEHQQAEPVAAELAQLHDILDQNPNFKLFLADPAISTHERESTLTRIFQGKVSPLLFNFVRLVNEKGRLSHLTEIIGAYDQLLDEQLGKVEVDLTVAHPLTPDQIEQARQAIGKALKKDVVIHTYVDDSIIGGVVLRVQDKLIDSSVKAQLQALKTQLLAARPK
jgi:F-type H+-transporting ATPase subunit delta